MKIILILLLILFENITKSSRNGNDNVQNKPFPKFRLKVEEVLTDQVKRPGDELSDNFVSFLIDNVKELFDPHNSLNVNTTYYGYNTLQSASLLDALKPSTDAVLIEISPANISSVNNTIYLPFVLQANDANLSKISSFDDEDNMDLLRLLKTVKTTRMKPAKDSSYQFTRTCISCDNLLNEDCSNPKSKLVPTVECQHEDDKCYSQHTPFGIVDRGCFNVNHDPTFFVCACNLCNYISIAEMPYIFLDKSDWVENVIELSRAKRFRDSIFKNMSCLTCEFNVTAKTANKFADANCLEGNVPKLKTQTCTVDEICAVKAIRSQGYIWRGCVTGPLYNYWWRLCDDNLCNYDALVSIYDTIDDWSHS